MRKKSRRLKNKGQTTLPVSLGPNENITTPVGPLELTRAVFRELGLVPLLDGLKRRLGASDSDVAIALVTHSMQMRGLSINRMEDVLDDPNRREVYGLGDGVDKNDLYRVCAKLGKNIDRIVSHIDTVLRDRFGVTVKEAYADWSASYLDGAPTDLVRFGHTKDHRPDRPQVSVGMVMEAVHGLLCGLTVMPGNTNDAKHFKETFAQVKPFLSPGCLLICDAGAHGEANTETVLKAGFHILTRSRMSEYDDRHLNTPPGM